MEDLTIDTLLENSCSNPDAPWSEQEAFMVENHRRRNATPPEEELPWTGWNRYRIELHCNVVEVVAREIDGSGKYEIKSWQMGGNS